MLPQTIHTCNDINQRLHIASQRRATGVCSTKIASVLNEVKPMPKCAYRTKKHVRESERTER